MITQTKINVNQYEPDVLTEGEYNYPAISKLGQLFTAGWQERLILAGRCYRLSIGTISGSGGYTKVGNGTTVDLDIPQGLVAVDSGFLIPMSLQLSGRSAADDEDDEVAVLLTGDRSQATSAAQIGAGTATAETPDNLLHGAPAFEGRVASIFTVAITDPVHSDIFYFEYWSGIGGDPTFMSKYTVDKEFIRPTLLAGPCTLLLYFGGTSATTAMGSLVFAHIPSAWAPVS